MRVGKALENRLRTHLTPSLIPLPSTVAFHIPTKDRTSPSGLLMNIPVYTAVLGLQMHCFGQRGAFFCLHILVPALGYSKAASALHELHPKVGAGTVGPLSSTPVGLHGTQHPEASSSGQSQPQRHHYPVLPSLLQEVTAGKHITSVLTPLARGKNLP